MSGGRYVRAAKLVAMNPRIFVLTMVTFAFGSGAFIFAGLLEGFGRQLITHDLIRYGVAGATAVLWGAYFYGPRREVAR